jgi:hypothetical protein
LTSRVAGAARPVTLIISSLLALTLLPVLAGCGGGGAKEAAVPNLVGQRLDVAESDLDDMGLKYQEIGGGTFGIIAKSNWTVCSTQPAAGSSTSKVKLIVDRVCPDARTGTAAAHTQSKARLTGGAHKTWAMPDLRGHNLQGAQDAIQSLTDEAIWYTSSHDVTGEGRGQWLDRDWKVCTQNVAPGRRIGKGTKIDFGVVRVSEPCP